MLKALVIVVATIAVVTPTGREVSREMFAKAMDIAGQICEQASAKVTEVRSNEIGK